MASEIDAAEWRKHAEKNGLSPADAAALLDALEKARGETKNTADNYAKMCSELYDKVMSARTERDSARAQNAVLREALEAFHNPRSDDHREYDQIVADALSASPSPDPDEAMRAKCEAIAREEEVANHSVNGTRSAHQIRMRIAALKGDGEGL